MDNKRTTICCIPSADGPAESTDDDHGNHQHRCRCISTSLQHTHHGSTTNSSMVIQSGPHGLHTIASHDISAGSIIVQCLPLAHSLLVPPGSITGGEDEGSGDDGVRKRCTRCFVLEGDVDTSGRRKEKFGRCSKCRLVYYCSRSCQVCLLLSGDVSISMTYMK